MQRGRYIVLEGGEGCGKSAQSQLLYDYLTKKKVDCILTREPGGTTVGEEIRSILLHPDLKKHLDTSLFLFEAARKQIFEDLIIPSLERGATVITDRSGYSTLAYQGYGQGVDLDLIRKLNEVATRGIKPDLMFILDIDPTIGLEKLTTKEFRKKDFMESQGPKFHARVNAGFLEIARDNPNISVVIPYREGDIKGMQKEIRKYVEERLFSEG